MSIYNKPDVKSKIGENSPSFIHKKNNSLNFSANKGKFSQDNLNKTTKNKLELKNPQNNRTESFINYMSVNSNINKLLTTTNKNNRKIEININKNHSPTSRLNKPNGENIILLTADEKKLQDIINSINKINNRNTANVHNKNNSEIINGKEHISSEKNEVNKKINTRNINNDSIKNEEINDEFIRPNFLNLYNNEDNSTIKQQIDVNTFNKTESSFLQTTESFLTNNILNDKSREENKNNIKPKNKKNRVISQVINKDNNINEQNNFLFKTFQSNSCSSRETTNKKENKRINKNKDDKGIYNGDKINDKINPTKQNLTNTKANQKNVRQKITNSEKSRFSRLRNDSYCNSIENKRKILGLEFKPNIKRELSIQTEVNSDRKNKFLNKIKQDKKNNKIVFSDKLIKVQKSKILNVNKKNDKKENNHSLIKNKTMASLNRIKKKLNFISKNEIVKQDNKQINYHIYI